MTLRARRRAVSGIAALAGALVFGPCRATTTATAQGLLPALARRLERQTGGRLGVCVLRTGDGRWTHRADERFPMCSLFKAIAAAGVLARVDRGELRLDRRIVFGRSDLVDHSPATAQRIDGDGMTLAELCDASMTLSDNTAGNLLLRELGGPEGFTTYVRSLGDPVTRLDRWEPELNEAKPGDPQTAAARTARPSRPAWSCRADRRASLR
ncbi:MAG TPA: serine hydrolase [Tahibacter sp.]|nr:serine hydrolase [Tahibacter sp.]